MFIIYFVNVHVDLYFYCIAKIYIDKNIEKINIAYTDRVIDEVKLLVHIGIKDVRAKVIYAFFLYVSLK